MNIFFAYNKVYNGYGENYYKENGNHHYDFIIKNKKSVYSYTLNEKASKIRKLIKKIDNYRKKIYFLNKVSGIHFIACHFVEL